MGLSVYSHILIYSDLSLLPIAIYRTFIFNNYTKFLSWSFIFEAVNYLKSPTGIL